MSIADRPYYRDEAEGGMTRLRWGWWRVTTWLIVINVAVFVLDQLLGRAMDMMPFKQWGHFSFAAAILRFQIWRLITFQFLHSGVMHLLFNMLCLHFAGSFLETHLGSRRFLGFYLTSGAGGAVVYLLFWMSGVLIESPHTELIGASAGVYGLLVALAILAPHGTVFMWPIPIPLTMRTLAWILIGIAMFTVVTSGQNAGGEAAHLGGAAVGYLVFKFPAMLRIFDQLPTSDWGKRRRQSTWQKKMAEREAQEREIDRILDKVHHQGLASLSHREKQTLEKASRRQ